MRRHLPRSMRAALISLGLLLSTVPGHAEPLPESVRLWQAKGWPAPDLQGLNLCKLAARCSEPQPFVPLDADFGDVETCDMTHIVLAYDGACWAGVVHPTDPHDAPAMGPLVYCQEYEGDGGETITLLRFQNVTKLQWTPTAAGEAMAVQWITRQTARPVSWGTPGLLRVPEAWKGNLPPKKQPTP